MARGNLPANRWALDSSVIIAHLKGDEAGSERSRDLIVRAEAGDATLFVSALAMVEVRKAPTNARLASVTDEDAVDAFFTKRCVQVVEVDRTIARLARSLCEIEGLPSWDAVHAATAIRIRADVLFSWDGDDLIRREQVRGVPVRTPYHVVKKSEHTSEALEQSILLNEPKTTSDLEHYND